jgi:hypothetical protein
MYVEGLARFLSKFTDNAILFNSNSNILMTGAKFKFAADDSASSFSDLRAGKAISLPEVLVAG